MQDFVEREDDRNSQSHLCRAFLRNIIEKDGMAFWRESYGTSSPSRSGYPYVFHPFWKAVWGSEWDADWRQRFEGSKRAAASPLARSDTYTVLSVVFDRLYTLRNQIFHGGATYPAGLGRD